MLNKVLYIFWKDLLMRKNHYIATIVEVFLPIALIILTNTSLPKQEHEVDNDPVSFGAFKDGKCVPRHSFYGNILYEPSTPFTNALMAKAACYAGYKKSNVKSGSLSDNAGYFSIGVKFNRLSKNSSSLPDMLNYTLYPTNRAWANMLTLWRYSGGVPRYSSPSVHEVVELQRAIDTSFLFLKNITVSELNLGNTNLYDKGPRVFSIIIYFALFLAFTLMVPAVVGRIVSEKWTGAKELMLMMGVVRWQLWVAKFMDVVLFLLISISGVVLFLYVPLTENSNTLNISLFLFWAIFMYGLFGVILFLFFMSCFFEKPTVAVYITEMIWFLSFMFNILISKLVELPAFVKYLMCLFPHVSLMQGVSIMLDFDFYGKSVQFTERLSGKSDSLCLLNVLSLMTFNIILYTVLTWYLEQVKPGKYGIPQPYNFCFKKSYWIPRKVLNSYDHACSKNVESFEPVPPDLPVGVSIQNVSKVYKTLSKGVITAVDCVSLDFYHSEISALLGHNGAGKTTVFSMITGLCNPTSGRVVINGYDLAMNACEARRSLGLCPQQNMLFDDLTTEQILKFYGVIKGLKLREAKAEAAELIAKLKLTNVRNTETCKLSGGQKRKVSLAIALIGGSKVLVLDEPTSGMDPEIRREIWEILLGFRGTRTILLTTHFMEEADALCDRIAIMDHGKIKCYGSPMFLKSKYGKGYVLSVVVLDLETAKDIVDYVKSFIPSAKFKSQNIRTLSFQLPESEVNVFPGLLSGLEEKQEKNEIASYCISLSTLEDVFLRLRSSHEATDDFDTVDSSPYKKLNITEDFGVPKVSKYAFSLVQLWSLLLKKWTLFKRSFNSYLLYSLIPVLLVIMSHYISKSKIHTSEHADLSSSKPLTYSLGLYTPSVVLYSDLQNSEDKQLFSNLVRSSGGHPQEVTDIGNAIQKTFSKDFYAYAKKLNLAVQFSPEGTYILHNEEAVHMIPISLNLLHNFLLKQSFKNSSIETSVSVGFANKDMHDVIRPEPECNLESLPDFSVSQTLFYLLGPVKERFYGAKSIQLMITSATLYWFSHLLFDATSFFVYIVPLALGMGFSESSNFLLHHAGEVVGSLLLWGCGLILCTYVVSTFTKDLAAAFYVNFIINIVFGFVFYQAISVESLPRSFRYLYPTCMLKFGFNDLCARKKSNYIWELVGYNCVMFLFLVAKDSKIPGELLHRIMNRFTKVNYFVESAKDEYVREEEGTVKKLISKGNISASGLLVSELKRWYFKGCRPVPAVRGISFAVNRGECFGLLGVNGAGKTSTFRMLTGGLSLSHGCAYACSERLSLLNRRKYLLSIGYCPQSGGLIPSLTGRELLRFYARLKGVAQSCVREEVQKWLEKLNLLEYSNHVCGTYSGGNQRKLSTAIALIGDPPLIFLDEPTSGVDPLSRRAIWNAIEGTQKEGQSVVLTSHSMDECEALCSRLAIMVNGRFRCIGETTTLKDRFGQGYCVQLKLTNGASGNDVSSLKNSVLNAFGSDCELMDEHLTLLQYHMKNKSLSWAGLFSKLSVLKESYSILESYTASATTLEQIFIYFARNH